MKRENHHGNREEHPDVASEAMEVLAEGIDELRRTKVRRLGDKFVSALEEQGTEVVDPVRLLDGIRSLYLDASLDEVVNEELPRILEADSQYFIRNQINLANLPQRLEALYGGNPAMEERYPGRVQDRVAHSVKVWLRHIRFSLVDHPDDEELVGATRKLKDILEGRALDRFVGESESADDSILRRKIIDLNDVPIPNIFEVSPEYYGLFGSYDSVEEVVREALPFVKDAEVRKVALGVTSHSSELQERAFYAKELIESRLNDARRVVVERDKPVPDYFDTTSKVYQKIIGPARDAELV